MAELLEISGCNNANRQIDLIFVHGLDGDPRSTWENTDIDEGFWPNWIAREYPNIGVWSLDYEARSLEWKGHSMPLEDRAMDVLDYLELREFGQRPIGFVCHSLGGLLVKQALRHAKELNKPAWASILDQSKFIIFLSTPHSGSNIANWIDHIGSLIGTTVTIDQLKAHHPTLRNLNLWFRENHSALGIMTAVYFEKYKTKKIMVVDETSADPGIQGILPIPQDADHITICKPKTKTAAVYLRVKNYIDSTLNQTADISPDNASKTKSIETENNQSQTRVIRIEFSGPVKISFCKNLGPDWRSLADILEIDASDQNKFEKGDEGREIWDWLERRRELANLPTALDQIDRPDLARELRQNPK